MNRRKYVCGVPKSECSGADILCPVPNVSKAHGSPQEAFKCYKNHLMKHGYKLIGTREFRTPQGTILVLTKPSKFGGVLRGGKRGEKQASGNVFVPKKTKGNIGGMIISK